jgi:hypothetical protein
MVMVVALCPSRGRPQAAFEVLRTFEETVRGPARLIFIVDADDPTANAYPPGHTQIIEPTGTMAGALAAGPALAPDATVLGMIGDDNRFRTPGWDVTFSDWLTEHPGIVFGDDGHQDEILAGRGHRLPTSWWLSRNVVDAFGMTHPGLRHYWMDNYWLELGRASGTLHYFPDVLIEHLHPVWQTAPEDATYQRGSQHARHDSQLFKAWRHSRQYSQDVARLRGLARSDRRVVLADWHHPGLYESLAMLFEDRFGWQLFSPVGMDWADQGYWRFTHEKWKAADYLNAGNSSQLDGWSQQPQPEYPERMRKMVTLAEADALQPDVVVATVPAHDHSFRKLADRYGARYVYQMGNAKQPMSRHADLILASVQVPSRSGVIRYHQEFSQALFRRQPISAPQPNVSSFMLRLESASCAHDWLSSAPGIEWHAWGGEDPRAATYLSPMACIAEKMTEAGFIWHDKRIGDGYGHVLHNAAALGRPLIGHSSHYRYKLGAPYWANLRTCIDLDVHAPDQALRLVRQISKDPDWHEELAAGIRAVFDEQVDFDAEAAQIRAAL